MDNDATTSVQAGRVEIAEILGRGYLRLTQKPRNCAESPPQKRLDLVPKESVTVVEESPQQRSPWT